MKKLSKMLICLMLCFMVTCLATNAAYTNRSVNSSKITLSDCYLRFKVNANLVVQNGKKTMTTHSETFEKYRSSSVGSWLTVTFNYSKPTYVTYSSHYEFSSYGTITMQDVMGPIPASGTMVAKIYR